MNDATRRHRDGHGPEAGIRIDRDYLLDTLLALLNTPSPSGYTDGIVHMVGQELERLDIEFDLTRRGAIRAVLRGRERHPARALVAHLDTLGAIVKRLQPNGRLSVVPIGHWSARFSEGARCTIFTDDGRHRGTILPLKASGHTFGGEIDKLPVGWDYVELRVDALVDNERDLEALGIRVGDIIAVDPNPEIGPNDFINSRYLDDKAGVATLLAAAEAVQRSGVKPPVDTYLLFTISEEVGSGASSILHGEIAEMVTIDNGTTAPGQASRETGVTVAMMDSAGPFDFHLTRKLLALCADNGISHQRDVFRHYRSDSASAIEAGNDLRTALVCFGIDASHGYERIHRSALDDLAKLEALYMLSEPTFKRDAKPLGPLTGFPVPPDWDEEETAERLGTPAPAEEAAEPHK
jgi:peptidase M42 family hydrolase